jgi:hypothetical protein
MSSDRVTYQAEGSTLEISIRAKPLWWASAILVLFLWPWLQVGFFLFTHLLSSTHPFALGLSLFFVLFFVVFLAPLSIWILWNFFGREVVLVQSEQLTMRRQLFGFGSKGKIFPVKEISGLTQVADLLQGSARASVENSSIQNLSRSHRIALFLQRIFKILGLGGGIIFEHKGSKHWIGLFSLSPEESREVFTRLRLYLPEGAFAA